MLFLARKIRIFKDEMSHLNFRAKNNNFFVSKIRFVEHFGFLAYCASYVIPTPESRKVRSP